VILRIFALGLLFLAPAAAAEFPLQFDRLTKFFDRVSPSERSTLDDSIDLLKKGDHSLALIKLKELTQANSTNAGLRVLLAYALLNAGNQLGAFNEAKRAERDGHDSYVCLFLAKVAYIAGDPSVCKREVKHVKKVGTPEDVAAAIDLEKQLSGIKNP
jgi:thioredoxin-like negative regulator of GroEL